MHSYSRSIKYVTLHKAVKKAMIESKIVTEIIGVMESNVMDLQSLSTEQDLISN